MLIDRPDRVGQLPTSGKHIKHGKEKELPNSPARWVAAAVLVFSQTANAADFALLAPVEAEIKALNSKDAEKAGACYTDNGVIVLRPDLPFAAERKINGRAEVTKWFEDLVAVNFRMEANFLPPEGNKIKAEVKTWTLMTEEMGVAPMNGTAEYTVEGGKIAKMLYVVTLESVQRFESARNRFIAIAAVILAAVIALIGCGIRRLRRRRAARRRSGG
jgi:hypothetical protein